MPNVLELYQYLDRLIPASLTASWDNDGCMCLPDPEIECRRVLLALDATDEAVTYAVTNGFDALVTHHPLIFRPLSALRQPKLMWLARASTAVFSFHTRLDATAGGVSDCLAEALGLREIVSFGDGTGRIGMISEPKTAEAFAAAVRDALASPMVCLGAAGIPCRRIAVVGGAGSDLIEEARTAGADTFVTGELHYHDLNEAREKGINLITAGHYETERPVLSYLQQMISAFDNRIEIAQFASGRILIL